MRTTRTVSKEVEITDEITCNKCGKSCLVPSYKDNKEFTGVNVDFWTGYWNKLLPDNTQYNFDLCEKCLFELIGTFVLPPSSYGGL